jgi:hypothetical protein
VRILLLLLALLAAPALARAQSVELYGAAGPTIRDSGNSVAVGIGFSPHPKLTLAFGGERTHLPTRTTVDERAGVVSTFRGGTLLLGTAELRVMPLGRERAGPYGVAGLADGVSRPNVNAMFPTRVTNRARAFFVGGGVVVPLGDRATVFADARFMFGAEGTAGIVAVMPVRAGLSWRF